MFPLLHQTRWSNVFWQNSQFFLCPRNAVCAILPSSFSTTPGKATYRDEILHNLSDDEQYFPNILIEEKWTNTAASFNEVCLFESFQSWAEACLSICLMRASLFTCILNFPVHLYRRVIFIPFFFFGQPHCSCFLRSFLFTCS